MLSENGKKFLAEKAGKKVDNQYCFAEGGLTLIAYTGERFDNVATYQVAGILFEQKTIGDHDAKNTVITDHGTYEFSYNDFRAANGGDIDVDDVEWIKNNTYCFPIGVTPTPTVETAKWTIKQAVDPNGSPVTYARIYIAKKSTTDPNDPAFESLRAYTPEDIIFCDGCDCSQFEDTNVSCVNKGFGYYTIKVEKSGYSPWLKVRYIEPGTTYEDTPILIPIEQPPETEAPTWTIKVGEKPAWIVKEKCVVPAVIYPGEIAEFKIAIETTYRDIFWVVLEFYDSYGNKVFDVESEKKVISPTDPEDEKYLTCVFEVTDVFKPGEVYTVRARLMAYHGP